MYIRTTNIFQMEFIDKRIEDYALAHSQPESDVLKKLNRDTYANVLMPRMLSGHMQGNLLSMFSKMIQPKQILEIGGEGKSWTSHIVSAYKPKPPLP